MAESSRPAQKRLSPPTSYYIRRLLYQNLDQLRSVLASGAGLEANPLSDLNEVLDSLYLEVDEFNTAVTKIERLTARHKTLATQGSLHRQELDQAQTEIFWLLGFRLERPDHRGLLLLVDDQPENLRLLSTTLSKQGYDIRSTVSGSMAITAAATAEPDLILLDIMMPGMDGYEVCRQLKDGERTADIPIIFVSAIDDTFDKVKAFQVGGADYITKPFRIEEVLARIENQMQLRQLQRRLQEQNVRLEEELQRIKVEQHQADLMRLAFAQIGDYVLFCDDQAQVLHGNEAACEQLGYSYSDLLTLSLYTIAPNLTLNQWVKHREKLRDWGFMTLEMEHRTADHTPLAVSLGMYYFQQHGEERICLVARKLVTA
jgi:DNA-binding response OmpR family regulator